MLAPVSLRIRFAPLAVVLLLLASWTPVSTAQANLVIDIAVPKGGALIYDAHTAARPPINFVQNGDRAFLHVTVINRGATEATNIPIYYWSGGGAADIRGCMLATSIPETQDGRAGRATVVADIPVSNLRSGLHLINITVNEAPSSTWGVTFLARETCGHDPKTEATTANDASDHVAWAFLVKDMRPDLAMQPPIWCDRVSTSMPCDSTMLSRSGDWHNSTGYPPEDDSAEKSTYFRLNVTNVGNYTDLTNWSSSDCRAADSARFTPSASSCDPLEYKIGVTIRGPNITGSETLNVDTEPVDYERGRAWTIYATDPWNLTYRGGMYNVTAQVDPTGLTIRQNLTYDTHWFDALVRTVELTASAYPEQWRTSPTNPYPFSSDTVLRGTVAFWNNGTANLTVGRTLTARAYIDSPSSNFSETIELTRTSSSNPLNTNDRVTWMNVSWQLSILPSARLYLSPGRHVFVAEIDPDNQYYELNDTNRGINDNRIEIPFYLEDTGKPTFPTYVENPLVNIDSRVSGASDTLLRPHQTFHVQARVNDTDTDLNVTAVFTLKNDTNVTRVYNLTRSPLPTENNRFFAQITNFTFYGGNETNDTRQNWTLTVVAKDPSGNNATSPARELTLAKWDVQSAPEDYFVLSGTRGIAQNHTQNYTDTPFPRLHLRILPNMTGFDQHNYSANLELVLDPPGDGENVTFNGSHWFHPQGAADRCQANRDSGTGVIPGSGTPLDPCPDFGHWLIEINPYDYNPGTFNATINVADRAGMVRSINRTFSLVDELPQVQAFEFSKGTINATESVGIKVTVDEDFTTVEAFANFTRADGAYRNVTLPLENQTEYDTRQLSWWNTTLETGRGHVLDLAGNFTVRVHAKDQNGNWNQSFERNLVIVDSVAPSVTNPQVTPPIQEIGANVTWRATITDQTNVTAVLILSRAGEEVFNATMEWAGGNNYTYTRNFTQPETYAWKIVAYDGNANGGIPSNEVTGILSIRDNLGPKYEVIEPGFRFDGERYGRAAQRIAVIVFDNDGVDLSTIQLAVDGVAITDYERAAAPAGYVGYTISYQVPATAGYSHNDTVRFDISAVDLSNKTLASEESFTYRVDDRAPTSRAVSFEPRHRDLEGQAWNISLQTRFTLAGQDNDGMPTGIETIRFQIIGGSGGSGAEQIYEKPFTIEEIAGAYTGPRPYLLQFWAEDDVGNRERPTQQINLYVDDTAPVLDPFGSLPQGRYINATFIDDRSGIDRAVVWYSLNGTPYLPLPLEPEGNVWKAVLPEGKKGEQMSYYLQAWDRVNNTGRFGNESEPYSSYIEGNHLPQLRITNPVLGQSVNRVLQLAWSALDEDDDPLTFIVYLKAPGRANFVELARLDVSSSRSYALDTSRYPDGQYTIALTASDGSFVARAETTVTFINSGRAVGNVTAPSDAKPGEGVLITAEVTKAQARVEARIMRDGVLVDAFSMNDEGRDGDLVAGDGIYSVRVVMSRSGDYSVEIVTQYQEGGETKESVFQNAASFTVALTPSAIFTEYAWLWVGIVALALAAIGIAGFGLYRKWR